MSREMEVTLGERGLGARGEGGRVATWQVMSVQAAAATSDWRSDGWGMMSQGGPRNRRAGVGRARGRLG